MSEVWRRRESNPRPRARYRRTLHACPLLLSHGRPGEEAKTASRYSREASRRPRPGTTSSSQPACLTSTPRAQATCRWTSLLVKQRERAANPQLWLFPPDLRVDGARHASHGPIPPSKPSRPHMWRRWPGSGEPADSFQYAGTGRLCQNTRKTRGKWSYAATTVLTSNAGGCSRCFFTAHWLAARMSASWYFSGKSGGTWTSMPIWPTIPVRGSTSMR